MSSNGAHPSDTEAGVPPDVYRFIGVLTRQHHDSLNELGYADQLRGAVNSLPDAKSRLSYISRLTGEAAEKVLTRVDLAKTVHDSVAKETQRIAALIVKDPVKAVARGELMNYVDFVNQSNEAIDQHLTEIMMAQDFHDLTGQVIARVVSLATTIEDQLVQLLIQTAPPAVTAMAALAPENIEVAQAASLHSLETENLAGPVVDGEGRNDVVTDQSQVDDLLASLGF